MVDDWWQAAPPTLRWESGGKKCGYLSGKYGILIISIKHVYKLKYINKYIEVYQHRCLVNILICQCNYILEWYVIQYSGIYIHDANRTYPDIYWDI